MITSSELRAWTTRDSLELYNIGAWGSGYFTVSDDGHLLVTPHGLSGPSIDLKLLVDDMRRRGIRLPLLLRFSDILADRVERISGAFQAAIASCGYGGGYQGVYPIKVNQERLVVEELVRFGAEHRLGLEAGSKPELLIGLALQTNPEALLICNGYKDAEYIRLALLAEKLGRRTVIVLDRAQELELVLRLSKDLGMTPCIGVRLRLFAKGAGRWSESSGDRSKFGLDPMEIMEVVRRLQEANCLDSLQLLHFHIGSQISAIRAIKDALREATRVYIELRRLGAPLGFFDVGGGLAVDYDGSQTNYASSANYTLDEYAADVVSAIGDACQSADISEPIIISESGRALTAHHSVLVFDVLGARRVELGELPVVGEDAPQALQDLVVTCKAINRKNFQEYFHDALQLREESQTLFNVGVFDLELRARAERLFWHCCARIREAIQDADYVPPELRGLPRAMADIYYCNFSVFQSVPDHWACKQLFPTLPIHRLDERPTRLATLADLTCDSDGKMDRFIGLHDVKNSLELHEIRPGEQYTLGTFLVGAYQEILGDLHNLFGDTHCVHISLDSSGQGYRIDDFEEGEAIDEVLQSVSYDRRHLTRLVRESAEAAVRSGNLSLEDSAELMRRFNEGLDAYTYLGTESVSELPSSSTNQESP